MKISKYNIEYLRWSECIRILDDLNESLNMLVNKWYTRNNKLVESTISPLDENYFTNRGQSI